MTRAEIIANHIGALRASCAEGLRNHAQATFTHAIYAALATPGCEAQGARLQDLPRLAEMVAGMAERMDALVAEREELAETLANERGEGEPPGPGWTWEARASTDMVGRVLSQYHAWLWGPDDTGFEVLREPDGRWAVALSLDHVYYFPTARAAMRAATLTETP